MSARSWLYVPGDRPEVLEKSPGRGADALVLDLEDAVPVSGKADARRLVASHLADVDGGPERWVRVSPSSIEEDVASAMSPGLSGIFLAKAEPEGLLELDGALDDAERVAGHDVGSTPVVALLETARALEEVREIARAPRVRQLALGEADLGAELGVRPGPEGIEFDPLRLQVVVASAAAGILAPIGPVSTDFQNAEALRTSTVRLARLGFEARQAIHPAQVAVVNEVLTPTEDEVVRAQKVVEAFERAASEGNGVLLDEDGRMVDQAVVRSARRVLARARLN